MFGSNWWYGDEMGWSRDRGSKSRWGGDWDWDIDQWLKKRKLLRGARMEQILLRGSNNFLQLLRGSNLWQ